ncbi:hypothetical protein [Niallia taxi]|uniref:hypothetical protein n=1 Tax=Niallia taxi TaxID=2499688 RepID=UPI00254AF4D7|nr:hypothetical protein [Niallia taxi]MDK8643790.1 hypothetical protein [Niallia taxi]
MDNGIIKRRRTYEELENTAEDILAAIEELRNEEKIKLLNEMFYKYYNNKGLPRTEIDWE